MAKKARRPDEPYNVIDADGIFVDAFSKVSKAKRYWIVETKEGNPIPMVAPCSEDEAAELCGTMDDHCPQYGPHRVVHLVEAGTVVVEARVIDPELAEVVREVIEAMREEESGDSDEDWLPCAVRQAARKLKPHQLRACGIEVPE